MCDDFGMALSPQRENSNRHYMYRREHLKCVGELLLDSPLHDSSD